MPYNSGDYYVLCARCGCKKLRSQVIFDHAQGQNDGVVRWLVCKEHYDGLHPLTRPTPVLGDNKPVKHELYRPEQIDFRSPGVWQQILLNWEDIDQKWETLTEDFSEDIIRDQL